ncbi:unnamed protein product, partial [Rotaria sp. Silwood1]
LAPIIDNLLYAVSNEPPVARSYIPLFGFALTLTKNPYEFIYWLHHQYGNRVTVNIMSRRFLFLNEQTTFMNRIVKDPTFTLDFLDKISHNGGGLRWECIQNEEAKRMIVQEYHEYLYGQELVVLNHKTCEYLIERLTVDRLLSSSSETVNLFDYFGEIIFDTAVTVLYGETFARSQPDIYSSCRTFEAVIGTMMLDIPFKSFFLRSTIRQRNQFIERFLDLKPNDDMSKLILARIESMANLDDGRVFNEWDRAGQHALLLWAAIINTGSFACWALVDLLLHHDALEAVNHELNTTVKNLTSLYNKETLDELRILDSCIHETMRRISPSVTQRQAGQNVIVTCTDGTQIGIRKNDIVVYPSILKHFDSEIYDHPYEYHYDRFIKQQSKVLPLILFGMGSRMCPGRYWAINKIKLFLAIVLIKLDIQLLMDDDYKQKMRTRLNFQLSNLFTNLGPHEKDKHQFRIRYSMKK